MKETSGAAIQGTFIVSYVSIERHHEFGRHKSRCFFLINKKKATESTRPSGLFKNYTP
jgi:hypothetical protein